ncbi:ATP-dependent DNA helicase [Paenibacillus mucilaginosus]|uniref:ATP-dependent helicase n=2 Tax=Paenibacillus mucilaginosus TaxID=61624 RepID=I0BNK1_9BACL|nr:ATP-dependent DNA helicase [Paenibacillus mucilaginosus]AEI44019.1 YpvA [Paenibacillus mucilaginosus KNP414]AFH63948.1 ATP-dependent helicase [Paenibacillus mucilaginosus K02]MCG7212493.1 ATP-dependent DNA helicase [Paenibacillus mucilaginosus]WDM31351.1 ATP-dependent DNA helicase [Paenibacillus mucilaginosus]WFA20138.1 ATP-dependent DNA helicase [Paenibacillus mucilaginosus]
MERYPFAFDPSRPFAAQVGEWVADVFYDILPEAGFEVRDEQIYMAFQLEKAYADKKIIFAEAGVGTGKTLAYLLYAVCYARYTRKPAVIACADESLIEQLVKPGGDVAKLAEHLDLAIDARLGKSPDQYLCLMKLDEARFRDEDGELFEEVFEGLPDFVRTNGAMQSFHPYGDRKHYPHLTDEQWGRVGWDAFQDCFVCEKRHRCGQTLSRDHYRRSADVIICSHDFYMEHVWTADSRKREGQLPLLPEHSSVVFDEGHLLETAAQKALTYRLKHAVFEELIVRLLQGEIRETLAVLIDEAIDGSEVLFRELERQTRPIPGSERMRIELSPALLREVGRFRSVLTAIEEELVFEGELYTLNEYQLRIVEEHLEMMQRALRLFDSPDTLICWAEGAGEALTLCLMPRTVKEVLGEQVFSAKMPVVFSSATLSVDGSFDYVADSLGIRSYLSFSVPSPYDYEDQMEALFPVWPEGGTFGEKLGTAARLLQRTAGRALVLFTTKEELRRFKSEIAGQPGCAGLRFLFEGDAEISHLIEEFQSDEESVLCAVSLWEGLDVPGPSLSNVIIWSLPFPPHDPVFMVKRAASASPFEEVELPYMLLRLRQGIGRLIRSREDRGIVAVFAEQRPESAQVRERIEAVLPQGVRLKELQALQG